MQTVVTKTEHVRMHEYLDWGNLALIVCNFMLWTFSLEDVNFWVAVSGAALTIITNLFRVWTLLLSIRKLTVRLSVRKKSKSPAKEKTETTEPTIDDTI